MVMYFVYVLINASVMEGSVLEVVPSVFEHCTDDDFYHKNIPDKN